jgi:hypothetical protein
MFRVRTRMGSIRSWLIRLGAGALTLSCLISAGEAATLNIDFFFNPSLSDSHIYNGLGKAPDIGTVWNGVGPTGSSSLLYSDNSPATGVSVSTTFEDQFSNSSGGGSPLLYDRLIASEATKDLTHLVVLSGLAPGGLYDLYAYAGYYSESFSATNAISATASGADFQVLNPANWVNGDQFALLSHAKADGSGTLALSINGVNDIPGVIYASGVVNPYATIAGLQLTPSPVPAPASLPLFVTGVGLMAFMVWHAKRKEARA